MGDPQTQAWLCQDRAQAMGCTNAPTDPGAKAIDGALPSTRRLLPTSPQLPWTTHLF